MLLLDTHVLLWLIGDSSRLGARTRERIRTTTVVHASTASLWEIAVKSVKGKLVVPEDLLQRIASAGVVWLDVRVNHAWAVRSMDAVPHADPFDRLLLAQASIEALPLVTADSAMLNTTISPLVIVDARE